MAESRACTSALLLAICERRGCKAVPAIGNKCRATQSENHLRTIKRTLRMVPYPGVARLTFDGLAASPPGKVKSDGHTGIHRHSGPCPDEIEPILISARPRESRDPGATNCGACCPGFPRARE